MIQRELTDGCHINPERKVLNGLGTSHLHTTKALKDELTTGGFTNTTVFGVMGGAWLVPNLEEKWKDNHSREALMRTVRILDGHEDIIGLSGHILAISKKKKM